MAKSISSKLPKLPKVGVAAEAHPVPGHVAARVFDLPTPDDPEYDESLVALMGAVNIMIGATGRPLMYAKRAVEEDPSIELIIRAWKPAKDDHTHFRLVWAKHPDGHGH